MVKSLPPLAGRFVPFAAVAAANCINIPLMRRSELQQVLFLWATLLYILGFYLLWTLLWLSSDLFVVVGFGFVMVIVKVYSYLFFYCSEYDDGFVYFYCYLILVIDIYMDIVMFTFSRNFYIYIK